MNPIAISISAPASVPPAGDTLSFRIELLADDRTRVLKTENLTMTVRQEATFTMAQARSAARADNTHLNSTAATGLLGIMTARGGVAAQVASAISSRRLRLRALTQRHDSSTYVTRTTGNSDPSQVGYFAGTTYASSFVDVAGAAAFSIGSGDIVVNRTLDVPSRQKRSDDELITLVIHEAVHAMDNRPNASTDIEGYKTEFRAYWMDGRYGPPDSGTCPSPPGYCLSTAYDPRMSPPGPKSPRARAIFDGLYGSDTYPFVKPAYDNNVNGFREIVDSYLIPDGINLIVATRLEDLRALIEGWGGANFAALRAQVQAYLGVGAAPAGGALTADERAEIGRNRSWRDLVERKVPNPAQQTTLKGDLGIAI